MLSLASFSSPPLLGMQHFMTVSGVYGVPWHQRATKEKMYTLTLAMT